MIYVYTYECQVAKRHVLTMTVLSLLRETFSNSDRPFKALRA